MEISECLDFEDYFRDPRFEEKKTQSRDPRTWFGDNIYYKDASGNWQQTRPCLHNDVPHREKDLRNHIVYVSEHFYYFG